ncbi:aldose epimerase family protein [Streptococcus thoraltensis]|uniref:aldose epimerase family protein n=1 Tax=Streptococcus thoraltensis TaxID=55085 RepID=UPI001F59E37C|nr:aldose epimerase family protein [Streptococcus thoraltensis]
MLQTQQVNTPNGTISKITLSNGNETSIVVSNLGATLLNFKTPDKNGKLQDIVLGFDTIEEYFRNTDTYFGATIGRIANRTETASFSLDGETFQIDKNEGKNNLHSGPNGYQIRIWEVESLDESSNQVTFKLDSSDGDQGYPGNLTLKITYRLTDDNQVTITYQALSDKNTPLSPTNHSYFNLNGHASGSIENHLLQLNASAFTPIKDSTSIPTGQIADVEGTPFDFRKPKTIGQDIDQPFDQLQFAGGYDHNLVLDNPNLQTAFATVIGDKSGIKLEAFTDLPGVQFYTGNFLNNHPGKAQASYGKRHGFCLETQFFPNAINVPNFPSPVLKANTPATYQTIYKVSIH